MTRKSRSDVRILKYLTWAINNTTALTSALRHSRRPCVRSHSVLLQMQRPYFLKICSGRTSMPGGMVLKSYSTYLVNFF